MNLRSLSKITESVKASTSQLRKSLLSSISSVFSEHIKDFKPFINDTYKTPARVGRLFQNRTGDTAKAATRWGFAHEDAVVSRDIKKMVELRHSQELLRNYERYTGANFPLGIETKFVDSSTLTRSTFGAEHTVPGQYANEARTISLQKGDVHNNPYVYMHEMFHAEQHSLAKFSSSFGEAYELENKAKGINKYGDLHKNNRFELTAINFERAGYSQEFEEDFRNIYNRYQERGEFANIFDSVEKRNKARSLRRAYYKKIKSEAAEGAMVKSSLPFNPVEGMIGSAHKVHGNFGSGLRKHAAKYNHQVAESVSRARGNAWGTMAEAIKREFPNIHMADKNVYRKEIKDLNEAVRADIKGALGKKDLRMLLRRRKEAMLQRVYEKHTGARIEQHVRLGSLDDANTDYNALYEAERGEIKLGVSKMDPSQRAQVYGHEMFHAEQHSMLGRNMHRGYKAEKVLGYTNNAYEVSARKVQAALISNKPYITEFDTTWERYNKLHAAYSQKYGGDPVKRAEARKVRQDAIRANKEAAKAAASTPVQPVPQKPVPQPTPTPASVAEARETLLKQAQHPAEVHAINQASDAEVVEEARMMNEPPAPKPTPAAQPVKPTPAPPAPKPAAPPEPLKVAPKVVATPDVKNINPPPPVKTALDVKTELKPPPAPRPIPKPTPPTPKGPPVTSITSTEMKETLGTTIKKTKNLTGKLSGGSKFGIGCAAVAITAAFVFSSNKKEKAKEDPDGFIKYQKRLSKEQLYMGGA